MEVRAGEFTPITTEAERSDLAEVTPREMATIEAILRIHKALATGYANLTALREKLSPEAHALYSARLEEESANGEKLLPL